MLLCKEYVVAEAGGCCYARSMSRLKKADMLLCNEYFEVEEGGCCYAMSISRLKRVDAVMQGVCRG